MAHIRFWKRIKIFPGVYLNIGKKGISISFGPRGVKYTVGTKGKRISAGIPGTGIYYVDQKTKSKKKNQSTLKENLTNDDILNQLKGK
jgi:hypothetical protein